MSENVLVIREIDEIKKVKTEDNIIFGIDVEKVLDNLPEEPIFDLVVTSPPYDIGKSYEKRMPLDEYVEWQRRIIQKIYPRLKDNGSICWEVGNYINKDGSIYPLDIALDPIFRELNMSLRNRIVWHFGHGLHSKTRFSGRYEVIMWYTKSDDYVFNLDPVRIPSKYPGKRHFKGPHKGELSGNPLGKNPEDVWDDIPNVKSNHVEKTIHPCQFPVGLIERLVLSMTNPKGLVFDPFAGVASAGVAALINDRSFWGCEIVDDYIQIGKERLVQSIDGTIKYRENKPLYDPGKSNLSRTPDEWKESEGSNS